MNYTHAMIAAVALGACIGLYVYKQDAVLQARYVGFALWFRRSMLLGITACTMYGVAMLCMELPFVWIEMSAPSYYTPGTIYCPMPPPKGGTV